VRQAAQHYPFAYLATRRLPTYPVIAQAVRASSPRTASWNTARLLFSGQ
jgi:hypothetical protein